MEKLFEIHRKLIHNVPSSFIRSLNYNIKWDARLIGIIGPRGVGKTTLLLQHIKTVYGLSDEILFISLDHIWFSSNSLLDLADSFVKSGGKSLFLDEVHKYPNWSIELKNLYDFYPDLKIVFTGSSLLEILNARSDLSRRALIYEMQGLSFREFLNLEAGMEFPVLSLEEVLSDHLDLAIGITGSVKPLKYFPLYLRYGYYPFYKEFGDMYDHQVRAVINMILEIELPLLRKVDIAYVSKIKQLLAIIADTVPFVPNVSKISQKIGMNRQTLLTYLHYLDECKLTKNLYRNSVGISLLQKPEKLYLENTNLAYAIGKHVDEGNLRETFFYNQTAYSHLVQMPEKGDFLVNEKFLFEIGGKGKNTKSWDGEHMFIAADGLESGTKNKIPLWLFGFLY